MTRAVEDVGARRDRPVAASGALSPGAWRFVSKLERRIVRRVGAAVGDFTLLAEGDHVLVAVSGGKDSLSMLRVLQLLALRSPVSFRLTVVTIHQGYAAFRTAPLEEHYRQSGASYHVEHVPIKEILAEKLAPGTIPCSLCSRIRRGALYTLAPRLGCNKIALGHHLDDLIETLLMNLFYGGQLRSMAPIYRSDDGRNVVIRPLVYVPEAWLAAYAQQLELPVTTCATEGCGEADTTRQRMKRLVAGLDAESPGVRWHVLRALRNVRAEHLLDRALWRGLHCTAGAVGPDEPAR